jgi:pyrroline-5-carboxylate reductase
VFGPRRIEWPKFKEEMTSHPAKCMKQVLEGMKKSDKYRLASLTVVAAITFQLVRTLIQYLLRVIQAMPADRR